MKLFDPKKWAGAGYACVFIILSTVILFLFPFSVELLAFSSDDGLFELANYQTFSDPILVFSTILAVILIAPILFTKLRLPGVIGIIAIGVVIGPSSLNFLEADSTVTMLGQIGLLYIMFIAGLEINLTEFFKHKDRSIIFGAVTFIIPQTLGTVLFLWMGFDWFASLLIASMFASHTLVAYPVITKLGLTQNKAVITTVGGTIITDTVALLLLAVIASGYQGDLDLGFWLNMGLMLLLYSFIVIGVVPKISRWFFSNIEDESFEFIFVLLLAFGLSYLARAMGIEPIVGAFFVGLVMNRLIPKSSPLMNRIQFVGNTLFIPFFLLYIGLLVDISVLASSITAWIVMGAMLGTNIITKLIASKFTQRYLKFSSDEGWVMFGLSTTEAAATLAATLVGYELGIIGDEVLNGVIMMILVTCIMGPIIVERFGRNIAVKEKNSPVNQENKTERILVPLANPEAITELINLATILKKDFEGTLYPLSVVNQAGDVEKQIADAENILRNATQLTSSTNTNAKTITYVDVNIANGISRAITENRITDVIMGWNRKFSTAQKIFGTVLDQLLHQTTQLLIVSNLRAKLPLHKRIVLCIPPGLTIEDGFERAFEKIVLLAGDIGVEIVIISSEHHNKDIQDHLSVSGLSQSAKITFDEVSVWEDLILKLQSVNRSDDLIVLMSSRRNTISFVRRFEPMPREIAETFEKNSLLVVYPQVSYQISHKDQ